MCKEEILGDPEARAVYDARKPADELASKLIALRKKLGLSQRDLARAAGLSSSHTSPGSTRRRFSDLGDHLAHLRGGRRRARGDLQGKAVKARARRRGGAGGGVPGVDPAGHGEPVPREPVVDLQRAAPDRDDRLKPVTAAARGGSATLRIRPKRPSCRLTGRLLRCLPAPTTMHPAVERPPGTVNWQRCRLSATAQPTGRNPSASSSRGPVPSDRSRSTTESIG